MNNNINAAVKSAPIGCYHIKFLSDTGEVLIHATRVNGSFDSFSTEGGNYASDVPKSEWEALEARVRRADFLVRLADPDNATGGTLKELLDNPTNRRADGSLNDTAYAIYKATQARHPEGFVPQDELDTTTIVVPERVNRIVVMGTRNFESQRVLPNRLFTSRDAARAVLPEAAVEVDGWFRYEVNGRGYESWMTETDVES